MLDLVRLVSIRLHPAGYLEVSATLEVFGFLMFLLCYDCVVFVHDVVMTTMSEAAPNVSHMAEIASDHDAFGAVQQYWCCAEKIWSAMNSYWCRQSTVHRKLSCAKNILLSGCHLALPTHFESQPLCERFAASRIVVQGFDEAGDL